MGSYKINYHLNGGTIDGETATNDMVTKEYPIMKGKEKMLTDYAISSPKKRFYSFSGWKLHSGESAAGQKVVDQTILDVYASYEIRTYFITYDVLYAEDCEMSDSYQNKNQPSFTLSNLPLTLNKPTDGTLEFYGWYFNNDTSKETLQITEDMEGVGYDDITLSGYFSDKRMCAIRFDANGHPDYFENLASFNTISNDPKTVALPESLYDNDPTKEYYLIGWEDSNGNIFPDTYEVFESKTLVLKAKRGNKTIVEYNYSYVVNNENNTAGIFKNASYFEYYIPGSTFLLASNNFESHAFKDNSFDATSLITAWQYGGVNYDFNTSIQEVGEKMIFNGILNKTQKVTILATNNRAFGSYSIYINSQKYDIGTYTKNKLITANVGDRVKVISDFRIKDSWRILSEDGNINYSGHKSNVNEEFIINTISGIKIEYAI